MHRHWPGCGSTCLRRRDHGPPSLGLAWSHVSPDLTPHPSLSKRACSACQVCRLGEYKMAVDSKKVFKFLNARHWPWSYGGAGWGRESWCIRGCKIGISPEKDDDFEKAAWG